MAVVTVVEQEIAPVDPSAAESGAPAGHVVRPAPHRWLGYAFGGRLPARHRGWVLHDTTTSTWWLRHLARTGVQLAVPIALVVVLLPAPWVLRLACALGGIFLADTANEWYKLIREHHLTIHTNLFGSCFYSLVGLHASHVIVGLIMMLVVLSFALGRKVHPRHAERVKILAMYWHFVDAVWVVVFTVVYIIGR